MSSLRCGGDCLLVLSPVSLRRRAFFCQSRRQQMLEELLHVPDMSISAQHLVTSIIEAAGSTVHIELPILYVVFP